MNLNMIKRFVGYVYRQMLPVNDPKFIIIGAQKSGTSSLHYYLRQHPQIVGSYPKEIHYFDRDIHTGKSIALYKQHFRGLSSRIHFEATPSYIYTPDTAARIHAQYPDIKLILVLRDPVKRAYSAWNHYRDNFDKGRYKSRFKIRQRQDGNLLYEKFCQGRTVFPSFRECIEIELELIDKNQGFMPALLRRGLYLQQLENYWKYFNEDQIMIIGFKDFISDTTAVLERITDFIGADNYNWLNLDSEPRNLHAYQAPIAEEDKRFLEAYYAESNKKLFERIGKLNW